MNVVHNVPEQFRTFLPKRVRISPHFGSTKKYLGARNVRIQWPDYTSSMVNNFGRNEHFQGVQRIGRRLIISGGIEYKDDPDIKNKGSQLIIVEMSTQQADEPWALPQYGYSYKNPPWEDRTIKVFTVDQKKWHAGGIQAIEGVVAVPIYGKKECSEIRFLKFEKDGCSVSELKKLEKDRIQSKAVGIARLPEKYYLDGSEKQYKHYLLVIWDDNRLDFHFTPKDRLEDGFCTEEKYHLCKGDIGHGFQAGIKYLSGSYQMINLVIDANGLVYLIAARNTSGMSPALTGKDLLDLYQITWPNGNLSKKPTISFVDRKQMYCYNQQCNFGAAAGIYINDEQHMFLYAAPHWLHNGNRRVNFNEYSY